MIELVGLHSAPHRKASGYSLGMRQRRWIAAAMLGDPPVLIMDEPSNGTGSEGIILMRHLVRSLAAEGRAVLTSSHLAGELQNLAGDIGGAGRGRALADASADEVLARTPRRPRRLEPSDRLAAPTYASMARPSSCPA